MGSVAAAYPAVADAVGASAYNSLATPPFILPVLYKKSLRTLHEIQDLSISIKSIYPLLVHVLARMQFECQSAFSQDTPVGDQFQLQTSTYLGHHLVSKSPWCLGWTCPVSCSPRCMEQSAYNTLHSIVHIGQISTMS
jgi:hypothetical protein